MEKYAGTNFVINRTDNGIFIELNDVAHPECCEEFTFDEIGYILERSYNSDYAKCAEEIYNATFSSSDIFTVEKIEQILKTHFAQKQLPDSQKNKIILKCPRCKSKITDYYTYYVCKHCGWNIDKSPGEINE